MKKIECPYCGGEIKKLYGKVISQSSHLAFGYGERRYTCGSCGEEHSRCYAVPPKIGRKSYVNKKVLQLSFKEGTSGYARAVVLSAKVEPAASSGSEETAISTPQEVGEE